MKHVALAVGLVMSFAPNVVSAEETQTEEVRTILNEIEILHASLAGKTITMRGAIGTFIGDQLYIKNDDGQFKVQFDAGRSARQLIEGCELEWFGWANSECVFEFDAEIKIEKEFTFADGGEIVLIVYELR